ncbi:hypothetical protein BFW01_g8579 [Lasiodiplodia theobromae]|nr:hypothetical protein BFW01_g8579 [Lasiodiplodia theobromae]
MPHALSDMSSSPAQKPGSPAGKELLDKGMRKFKIVHRILQYEDALIKPGEDARDLRHRTQYRRGNTTRSPTATPRLHASRRAGTSISSDYSATSSASNGSNSTASGSSNSSSSSASLPRRTDALCIQHSDLDYSTRKQSRYRFDANTSYTFHASEDNVSEMTIPEASATASPAITSPHPGTDHAAPGMQPLDDAMQEQSEPDSSAPSNDHQPTPPSDDDHHQDTDDASSEHDDSDATSDDSRYSPDPLQRDFLEEILRPVKQHLFQRLMVYIANSTSLGLPLPAASLYGCSGTVKTEVPEAPTSLPIMQKDARKRAASQDSDDKVILAAAPKEAPASTDQGLSASRANGKRPSVTTNGCTGSTFMGASRKRKMGNADSPGDNDDSDDDDDDERRRPRKPRKSPSPPEHHEGRRIACPYFKRNPRSPAKADACFRTGFRDITKMKEHLERVHDCSIQCPRCYKVFKTQDDVNTHLRRPEDQMCARVQERPFTDGYNAAQAGMLRGRMRNKPLEEKWKYIWRILFPADQDDEIPPPWWVDRDEIQGMNFYTRYENFMRNDLPRRVEQGVLTLVDQLFLSETLQGHVETIVQNCLEQSYSLFRRRAADGQTVPSPQHEADLPSAGVQAVASSSAVSRTAAPSATVDPRIAMLGANPDHVQPGLWPATPGRLAAPAFTTGGGLAQQQPVVSAYIEQHPAPVLTGPGLTQPGLVGVNEMDTSFLNVEHDVTAIHTPMGRSPDGQWDSMDDAAALFDPGFDDLSSRYHASFLGGNHNQGGYSRRS